jgi:hypothetical protein
MTLSLYVSVPLPFFFPDIPLVVASVSLLTVRKGAIHFRHILEISFQTVYFIRNVSTLYV